MFHAARFMLLIMSVIIASVSFNLSAGNYATVLYFNDAHIVYPLKDHLGERGGVARLKTVIDQIRKENSNTIVIFGGDLAGGLLFGAVYHGFPVVEGFNQIGVDLANFGQHDFDFGPEETLKLIAASKFQWFTSNLVAPDGKPFAGLPKYYITDLSGIKIAIIGLTDDMNTTTPTDKVKQLPLDEAVSGILPEIEKEKPDAILVITQSNPVSDEVLLKKFPVINAIFSEEVFEAKSQAVYTGERPVLSACGNAGSILRLDIFRENGKTSSRLMVYSIDDKVAPDSELFKLEEKYREKLESDLGVKLADLKEPLDAGFDTDYKARFKECNVGDLIADSYRNFYKTDIAFMNGGGIRANAPAGIFTLKNTLAVLPFSNTIAVYKCSGKIIRQALEYGVSGVEKLKGSFLQVSGLRYSYNPDLSSGQRIVSVELDGKALDAEKLYTVAMPAFIYKGGDGFDMFKDAEIVIPESSGRKDIEIFSDYCRTLGIIDSKTDGRITISALRH